MLGGLKKRRIGFSGVLRCLTRSSKHAIGRLAHKGFVRVVVGFPFRDPGLSRHGPSRVRHKKLASLISVFDKVQADRPNI